MVITNHILRPPYNKMFDLVSSRSETPKLTSQLITLFLADSENSSS